MWIVILTPFERMDIVMFGKFYQTLCQKIKKEGSILNTFGFAETYKHNSKFRIFA